MATRPQVELGVVGGHGGQGLHLVVQDRPGQVAPDRPLPGRAAARGAAPVGDQDREALVGEPLGDQEAVAGGQHLAVVRPAVGVEQHRQPPVGGGPPVSGGAVGEQQGAAQLARAGPQQPRPRGQARRLGQRGDRQRRPAGGGDGRGGVVVLQVGAGDHHHPAGRGRGVHAGPVGEALGVLAGDDPPQVDLGRLLGPGDQDAAAGHGHHLGDLEPRRGDGLAVDGRGGGCRRPGRRRS